MRCCSFFGHKDAPEEIRPVLKNQISNLIVLNNVGHFLVGNNGSFDTMVYSILKEQQQEHPQITFNVVLAYIPVKKLEYTYYLYEETIVPDCVENGPIRFAISRRNKWMIEQSDYVVTYVTRNWGGAAQFKNMAESKNKTVINIAVN